MGRRPTSITEEYGEVDSRQTLWVKAPHVTDAAQHPLPIPALVNGSIPPRGFVRVRVRACYSTKPLFDSELF